MKLVICIAFFVAIGSASAAIFWPTKVCTILATVPYRNVPYEYYWFPSTDDKVEANRRFFVSESNKVWVDAPRPDYCGDDTPPHGICTLLGHYRDPYDWFKFESAKKKFQANRELLDEADYRRQHYFKVWVDAPDSYCR